jgi:hypothetical protein
MITLYYLRTHLLSGIDKYVNLFSRRDILMNLLNMRDIYEGLFKVYRRCSSDLLFMYQRLTIFREAIFIRDRSKRSMDKRSMIARRCSDVVRSRNEESTNIRSSFPK